MGRWHICRLACSVSLVPLFLLFSYHDFGVIDTPIGARVFVRQMTICGTKTHLANVKMGVYPLSEHLHPLSAGIQKSFEY